MQTCVKAIDKNNHSISEINHPYVELMISFLSSYYLDSFINGMPVKNTDNIIEKNDIEKHRNHYLSHELRMITMYSLCDSIILRCL